MAVGCAGDESLQEEPSAHADLLERLLQLRPVHRLSGAHPARPALPDPELAVAGHLGLLLAAILLAGRELLGRRFQEDVSQQFRSCSAHRALSPSASPATSFLWERRCCWPGRERWKEPLSPLPPGHLLFSIQGGGVDHHLLGGMRAKAVPWKSVPVSMPMPVFRRYKAGTDAAVPALLN